MFSIKSKIKSATDWSNRNPGPITAAIMIPSMVIIAWVSWTTPPEDDRPARPTIGVCNTLHGRTEDVCWEYDKPNGWYLNLNYGRSVYVPATGDVINWDAAK